MRPHGCFPGRLAGRREQGYDLAMTRGSWMPLLAAAWLPTCAESGREHAPAMPNFDAARALMVRAQLEAPGSGITNLSVLRTLAEVPRHEFVPPKLRSQAYDDHPLPIGHGQTISQPFIVAFMTQALDPRPTDRMLEIGTGSGYQAAVLARLVREVLTIEIVEPLAHRAAADLQRLGFTNVTVRAGDGFRGWPEQAPFDAIIVTCAPTEIPRALVEQLRDGGRMIIPVGDILTGQDLYLLRKRGTRIERQAVLPVRFVPMVGGVPDR